jgi:hypothetical protein
MWDRWWSHAPPQLIAFRLVDMTIISLKWILIVIFYNRSCPLLSSFMICVALVAQPQRACRREWASHEFGIRMLVVVARNC